MRPVVVLVAVCAALLLVPAGGALDAPVPCTGSPCWQPPTTLRWNYVLSASPDLSIAAGMYDIDMFDNADSTVASIHAAGRRTICYISAGTWENWRPDAAQFPASVKGRSNGWPGEKWLDVRRLDVLGPIMGARLDLCKQKGFDGVELDNVDGYSNSTGFPLTYSDQLEYNVWLANQAHARGLTAALKNDLEQVGDLIAYFDYAVNESCFEYSECDLLAPFTSAGKAVFHVEYKLSTSKFCKKAKALGFNSIKKKLALGNAVTFCP